MMITKDEPSTEIRRRYALMSGDDRDKLAAQQVTRHLANVNRYKNDKGKRRESLSRLAYWHGRAGRFDARDHMRTYADDLLRHHDARRAAKFEEARKQSRDRHAKYHARDEDDDGGTSDAWIVG